MEYYGIIGNPIGHSLSPLLHSLIYEQLGHLAQYSRFPVDPANISEVIPAIKALGLRGINVTSPHKQAILPYLDALSPAAEAIGAVNTVSIREDGSSWGDNTDAYGFAESLVRFGVEIPGKRFVLCGNSGAGKAVVYALETGGAADVLVASTDPSKGIPYSELPGLSPRDVIVNCTPVGMHPKINQSVVDKAALSRFGAAVDLIYNPIETMFMQRAATLGLTTFNGLWMLIYQGIRSFELWTGEDISRLDVDAIYQRLKEAIP